MAFKMKRGNLGKTSSNINKQASAYPLIRMGVSKRIRKLFGGKRHIPKKGHYDIDRSFFGPVDWDHTWGNIKDFFGGAGDKLKGLKGKIGDLTSNINIKKPELKGGKQLLPTTIAQKNVERGGTQYVDDVYKDWKKNRKTQKGTNKT